MLPRRFKLNRVSFILAVNIFFALVILIKLFDLQVLKNNFYLAKAEEGHLGYSEVTPQRGEILMKDYNSQEVFRLATNSSIPLLYADPTLIKDPAYVADKLAPLLFDLNAEKKKDAARIRDLRRMLSDSPMSADLANISPKAENEMRQDFRNELFDKLSQKTRQSIILYKSPPENLVQYLQKQHIVGIDATADAVTAFPAQISDTDYPAKILSPIIDIPYDRLKDLLAGRNRYVVLRQKTPPVIEQQIRALMSDDKKSKRDLFTGINFQEKTYRYYPEGRLAAQIVGFISDLGGLYGIEQSFDAGLHGKKGIFKTELDATGQQVIVGNDVIIQPAINGDSVMLTIDRSVQMEVEKALAKAVEDSRADSGLVIIMEPKTGRIISMAHYPTFDPNNFGDALETEDIILSDADKQNITTVGEPDKTYYLNIDPDSHYRIQIFPTKLPNGKIVYSKYKNVLGSGVYRNHAVSDIYEPGSVFKILAMSIALDDGDVTPQTTYNDTGPIKVDEFEIHNSTNKYYGITSMREVLEKSLNTGMSFVARKMGRELFYRYLKKFGFGERTDIEFEGEESSKIQDASRWAESELLTYAFGQGIAVTPIQLITAASALANKGILMKPHIVEQTEESSDGKVTAYEPEQVRRVLSEKAAATITAMMVSVVENGGANRAKIPGYFIAGKTGTAQTYKHGEPLTGIGTTIASFIGFGPIRDPRFVVLVKMDRPRSSIWADSTAAPLFAEITQFLLKYYNIPPDK